MRLWNEYEGKTIANAYPIESLIRPEGRSAFFTTSNGTGIPAVIRLIESIHDETEILPRWQTVANLNEKHLVTLKKFGQTVFEGTPLIYVLMESTEIDLASILQQGTLSTEDARQLGISLIEAVEALHGAGLVHEHIEPANVLAKGDLVKLRSDCIREAPEGAEGVALIRQDVRDIAVVLLQALTQQKNLDALGATRLSSPFDAVIRNGIQGTWGLAQMASALSTQQKELPTAVKVTPSSPLSTPVKSPEPTESSPRTESSAVQMPLRMPEPGSAAGKGWKPYPARRIATPTPAEQMEMPAGDGVELRQRQWWMVIAPVVFVILAALGWHLLHRPTSPAVQTAQPITTLPDTSSPSTPQPVAPSAASTNTQPAEAPQPATANPTTATEQPHWRVIAYTYHRQEQAQHKVETLLATDSTLQAEVFHPNERSPYLVTVGGAMSREDAAHLRNQLVRRGLPSDTYIQNYGGR